MNSPAVFTFGYMFIGLIFNILLYGVVTTQVFLYYTTYRRDRSWIKLYVAILFFCDTLNSIFDIACVYIPLINNFGDTDALGYASWWFGTDPAMTVIIAMMVQMFFAWRVKVLTGSMLVVCFIVLCSIGQFCGGLGMSIAIGMIPQYSQFRRFEAIVIVWLACAVLADVAITISLVWRLRSEKTGFPATDDVVNKIIRMTVQTGLITTLCGIAHLVSFLATSSGIHLIFNLCLAKLYTISLMSSLNARNGWKYGNALDTVSSMARDPSGLRMQHDIGKRSGPTVFIDIESHEMVDDFNRKASLPAPSDDTGSHSPRK